MNNGLDEERRSNVTLKRPSSALTARLVLTVLIIASISGLSSVRTVTAQQNNTTTTATTTATAIPTPEPQEIDSPGFSISTTLIAGLAILLTAYWVST